MLDDNIINIRKMLDEGGICSMKIYLKSGICSNLVSNFFNENVMTVIWLYGKVPNNILNGPSWQT
jgi:hypothetical protein